MILLILIIAWGIAMSVVAAILLEQESKKDDN